MQQQKVEYKCFFLNCSFAPADSENAFATMPLSPSLLPTRLRFVRSASSEPELINIMKENGKSQIETTKREREREHARAQTKNKTVFFSRVGFQRNLVVDVVVRIMSRSSAVNAAIETATVIVVARSQRSRARR